MEWWSNHRIKGEDLIDGGDVDVFKVNININKWKCRKVHRQELRLDVVKGLRLKT